MFAQSDPLTFDVGNPDSQYKFIVHAEGMNIVSNTKFTDYWAKIAIFV